MILRKPYAFFIKYFRLINLIMAVFMGIMVYRTIIVSRFLDEYVNDYTIDSTSFSVSKYMNFYSFLMVFFIIVLTLVITSVMFVKNKPKKLYIINLAIYVAVMILYMVDYSTINTISTKLLDFRVSGALRDINYMLLIAQVVSLLLTLVRATGFDIKSFEFAQDFQDLDINTKDNEEFEVSLEFDKNKAKRNFRRNVRNLKYSYIEHKFFINMTVVIILLKGVFAFFMNNNISSSYY
ncbi:MAG: hypothetical protein IJ093_01865, partial [Bacilli bacterium]|nr:hypothetical protein [Bacilli bacterium]